MIDQDNAAILASGGFNSGRLYTQHGQRIYWQQLASGWVVFRDLDRMAGGHINRGDVDEFFANSKPDPYWIMRCYDEGKFQNHPPADCPAADWMRLSVPDDFDFGEPLRI